MFAQVLAVRMIGALAAPGPAYGQIDGAHHQTWMGKVQLTLDAILAMLRDRNGR